MKRATLRDLLVSTDGFEPDDSLYVEAGMPLNVDSALTVIEFDPDHRAGRKPHGTRYFLGIEQLRDAIEAAEMELGRRASILERFRAVVHYSEHDAFADVDVLLGSDRSTN